MPWEQLGMHLYFGRPIGIPWVMQLISLWPSLPFQGDFFLLPILNRVDLDVQVYFRGFFLNSAFMRTHNQVVSAERWSSVLIRLLPCGHHVATMLLVMLLPCCQPCCYIVSHVANHVAIMLLTMLLDNLLPYSYHVATLMLSIGVRKDKRLLQTGIESEPLIWPAIAPSSSLPSPVYPHNRPLFMIRQYLIAVVISPHYMHTVERYNVRTTQSFLRFAFPFKTRFIKELRHIYPLSSYFSTLPHLLSLLKKNVYSTLR